MGSSNDMVGAVSRSVDQASNSVHNVIDKASEAARPAVDRVATGAHHAVDSLANAASDAAKNIDKRGEQFLEAQSRFTENCRTYVREKPFTTLGIAIASGFLLSWVMRAR